MSVVPGGFIFEKAPGIKMKIRTNPNHRSQSGPTSRRTGGLVPVRTHSHWGVSSVGRCARARRKAAGPQELTRTTPGASGAGRASPGALRPSASEDVTPGTTPA